MLSYVKEWKIATELEDVVLEVHLDPYNLIRSLINEEKGMILKASQVEITPLQLRNRAAHSQSKH